MRALTAINLILWAVLFVAWIPYTLMAGAMDSTSVDVRWILCITAALQLALFGLRIARHRPVLG